MNRYALNPDTARPRKARNEAATGLDRIRSGAGLSEVGSTIVIDANKTTFHIADSAVTTAIIIAAGLSCAVRGAYARTTPVAHES